MTNTRFCIGCQLYKERGAIIQMDYCPLNKPQLIKVKSKQSQMKNRNKIKNKVSK